MEKEIRELLGDVREFCAALQEYFALRDKVLWTGSAGKGSTINVPGLSKYQLVLVNTTYSNFLWNPQTGLKAIAGDIGSGSDIAVPHTFYGSRNGDKLTISHGFYYYHNPSSAHGGVIQTYITKITGLDPVIPESLKKYLGGGVLQLKKIAGCTAI